jgi:hypothetical protein
MIRFNLLILFVTGVVNGENFAALVKMKDVNVVAGF